MNWAKQNMSVLVFNRRRRLAISRAKRVLVHLSAGDSRKEIERVARARGFEVISVGEKEDTNSPQTFDYLLQRAALGNWTQCGELHRVARTRCAGSFLQGHSL